MGRSTTATTVLNASERWKLECLLGGGSLFGEDRLWTREYFGELQSLFVERPDEGNRSFEEKLRDQLAPATPEAKRLWAEITWVYYLIVDSETVKRVTKLDGIRTVWEWSGVALPEDHWALGDVLDKGIVNPGLGYFRHKRREFRFIVTLMLDWCSRSARERESLLSDPWGFAEWIEGQKEGRQRQFRHAVLFLLFPEALEPIMAPGKKRRHHQGF